MCLDIPFTYQMKFRFLKVGCCNVNRITFPRLKAKCKHLSVMIASCLTSGVPLHLDPQILVGSLEAGIYFMPNVCQSNGNHFHLLSWHFSFLLPLEFLDFIWILYALLLTLLFTC